ncbi:hypothetical protein ATL41_1228 [Flavimobilis soli]|uniref:Uncharacterized protein n=1 Tax=Flavimobilis soli TaxID=442709 RepID=A0A2A9ED82_9MICO|nr:hypothetical protein [Flavimobilis soli]PFG36501.1 hypothetical protein ATL41_1228 [Flavimobilis soli]
MATTHPHPGFPSFSRAHARDERRTLDTPPSFPPADVDDDADGWKTSTAPTAVSVALLTALATALALGLREVVSLASAFLGA